MNLHFDIGEKFYATNGAEYEVVDIDNEDDEYPYECYPIETIEKTKRILANGVLKNKDLELCEFKDEDGAVYVFCDGSEVINTIYDFFPDKRMCCSDYDIVSYKNEQMQKEIKILKEKVVFEKEVDKDALNLREVATKICGLFEDLLDKSNISVPSTDREGEEDEARIFGDVYYDLEDRVTMVLVGLCEKIKANQNSVINVENYNEFIGKDIPKDKIMMAILDEHYFSEYGSYPEEYDSGCVGENFVFDTPEELIKKWYEINEGAWYWVFDKGELICSGVVDPGDIEIFENYFELSFEENPPDLPKSLRITAAALAVDTDAEYEDEDELSDIISDYLSDVYGFCHYGFNFDVIYNEFNEPSEIVVTNIKWDVDIALKPEIKTIKEFEALRGKSVFAAEVSTDVDGKLLDKIKKDKDGFVAGTVNDFFDYMFDEEWTFKELVEILTPEMKEELIFKENWNGCVGKVNGKYYYHPDVEKLIENPSVSELISNAKQICDEMNKEDEVKNIVELGKE